MKIKNLFAIATLLLGSTSMFAKNADVPANTNTNGSQGYSPLTYDWKIDNATDAENPVFTATVTGLVQNITVPATVEIPDSVEMVVTIEGTSYTCKFQVTKIAANAFAGTPAAAITAFTINAKGLATIEAGAFSGTKITKLDLSKTKVAQVLNWFGTTYAVAGPPAVAAKTNSTLEEVTLSNYWTTIAAAADAPGAFGNCTALKTINFGKVATGAGAPVEQTIGKLAFENTILAGINLYGTKVDVLPANGLLFAPAANRTKAAATQKNASLKSVVLPKGFKNLNKAFAYCTALETISLDSLTNEAAILNANELDSCIALKKVVVPANIVTIPAYAFNNCKALASVYFNPKNSTLKVIEEYAFSACAMDTITVPMVDAAGATIAQAAFANCGNLTTFTFNGAGVTNIDQTTINNKAFVGCNDYINLVVSGELLTKYETTETAAPMHCQLFTASGAPAKELEGTAYADGSGRYYVKYKNGGEKDVAIDASIAKVYAAYLNDGTNTLDMIRFKTRKIDNVASYVIAPGDVVLIVSNSDKVAYTTLTTANKNSSWLNPSKAHNTYGVGDTFDNTNQLLIVTEAAGTTKAALETACPDGLSAIYVWVNSAKNKATGFQKLGNITNIKKDVLYVYANPAADGARLNIRWLDENGNVEEETTAIQSIESAKAEDDAIYNLAGQKVNASYKGLVIKNGKKYMK